jgi:cell division protein FtsL
MKSIKKSRKQQKKGQTKKPVVKLRYIALITGLLFLCIAGPLFIVWKQVSIHTVSVELDRLTDSLSVMHKEAASLRAAVQKLSRTARIETVATKHLDMHYPSSDQITIIEPEKKETKALLTDWEFLAIFKKSLIQDKANEDI